MVKKIRVIDDTPMKKFQLVRDLKWQRPMMELWNFVTQRLKKLKTVKLY